MRTNFPSKFPQKLSIALTFYYFFALSFSTRAQKVYTDEFSNECVHLIGGKIDSILAKFDQQHFNQAIKELDIIYNETSHLSHKCQIGILELISLSYLYQDSLEQAKVYALSILNIEPNYKIESHPNWRFRKILEEFRDSESFFHSPTRFISSQTNSTGTTVVITAHDLLIRGYQNLIEVLQDVPGIDISFVHQEGFPSIFFQGIKESAAGHFLFLIDGSRETDAWGNLTRLSNQYPLSMIKRIEISYGPSSDIFGPGAFAGVIHIQTFRNEEISKFREDLHQRVGARGFLGMNQTQGIGPSVLAEGSAGVNFNKNISAVLNFRISSLLDEERHLDPFLDRSPYFAASDIYFDRLSISDSSLLAGVLPQLPTSHPYYTIIPGSNGKDSALEVSPEGIQAAQNLDKSLFINPPELQNFIPAGESYFLGMRFRIQDFHFDINKWEAFSFAPASLVSRIHAPRWDRYFNGGVNAKVEYTQQVSSYTRFNVSLNFKNFTNSWIGEDLCGYGFASDSCYNINSFDIVRLVRGEPPQWSGKLTEFRGARRVAKDLRGEFNADISTFENLILRFGVEANNIELIRSYRGAGDNPLSSWNFGGFAGIEYNKWKNLILAVQIRGQGELFYSVFADGGFSDRERPNLQIIPEPIWNARINFLPFLSEAKRLSIQGQISRGINLPSRLAMYPDTSRLSNPTGNIFFPVNRYLRAERTSRFEIKNTYISPSLSVVLSGYYQQAPNILTTIPHYEDLPLEQLRNDQAYRVWGLLAQVKWRVVSISPHQKMEVWGNYSFTNAQKRNSDTGNFVNVGGIAKNQLNTGITYQKKNKFFVSLSSNIIGRRPSGLGTTLPLNGGDFPTKFLLNSTISYDLNGFFLIQLIGRNLFNTEYTQPGPRTGDNVYYLSEVPQPGRSLGLRVSYQF